MAAAQAGTLRKLQKYEIPVVTVQVVNTDIDGFI